MGQAAAFTKRRPSRTSRKKATVREVARSVILATVLSRSEEILAWVSFAVVVALLAYVGLAGLRDHRRRREFIEA